MSQYTEYAYYYFIPNMQKYNYSCKCLLIAVQSCINSFWIEEKEVSREMNKVNNQINDSQPKYMLYMYHFVSSFSQTEV